MAKMFQMNVHIPNELNDELVACASKQGITKSEFVRRSLKKAVKQDAPVTERDYETAYDSMTVDLNMESRVEELEKKLEEKENKSWIRKKLNL